MRLMLVEDNQRLAGLVAKGLRVAGFAVDVVFTGSDAEIALSTNEYDAAHRRQRHAIGRPYAPLPPVRGNAASTASISLGIAVPGS